ncbi:MAG: hypothetical protein U1E25_16060 [Methylocystis sp.]
MFVNADIVVKIVMIGLLLASVATWTILVAKTIELKRARVSCADGDQPPVRSLRPRRGAAGAGGGDRLTQSLLAEARLAK